MDLHCVEYPGGAVRHPAPTIPWNYEKSFNQGYWLFVASKYPDNSVGLQKFLQSHVMGTYDRNFGLNLNQLLIF
jgi:hypothetical protein